MKKFNHDLKGHLDIFVGVDEEEHEGEIVRWNEVLIHGDPEGLISLANLLLEIANADQEAETDLPEGAREHVHLGRNRGLSGSSDKVIIGRLDAKGTGKFYSRYIPQER